MALAAPPAWAQAPCAPPAAPDPMPEGAGHDHADPAQHRFACALELSSYLGLDDLVPEPVMFGEVDVAGGIAVMATAFKEAGFVTFDLSDPAHPRPLARYQGPRCEEVVFDSDCGADVKLSRDGKVAFLAIQNLSRVTGPFEDPAEIPQVGEPGIHVVDVSNPAMPLLNFFLPIEPFGIHMLAYHEIGGTGYVFAVDNFGRIAISQVVRAGPLTVLLPFGEVRTGGHDVFLFDDPADGKTYLYVAGGGFGLRIYDVTDPGNPVGLGAWDPGPEWYTHSAWTIRRGDRRYTFVAPELFFGARPAEPGPLWMVDTTDHARPVLVGTWTNPGGHRGGNLGFSPHNIWASADGMTYLAHYHGGVWLLDWEPVLAGAATRPSEVGYYVPHEANRPFVTASPLFRFITAFEISRRPSVWDVVSDGTYTYASDITGGLYVLHRPR